MPEESAAALPDRIHAGNWDESNRACGARGTRLVPRNAFRNAAAILVLLFVVAAFHLAFQPKNVLHSTDSMFYLTGAKSLAEGNGYRMVLYEGEPRIGLYPPLQSAYLSLFWRMNGNFPENLPLLNGAMLLLLLALVTLFAVALLKFEFPLWAATIIPLCFAIQPDTFGLITGCYSDLLFALLATILALLWMGDRPSMVPLRWGATGMLLGLMFLTRTAAAPFLLGAILASCAYALHRKTWKPFVWCIVPMAAAVTFWIAFPKETAAYTAYFQIGDLESGRSGLWDYALSCGQRAVSYGSSHLVDCFMAGLPGLLAAIVPGSRIWRSISVGGVSLLAALAILICVIGYAKHPSRSVRVIGGILVLYCIQLIFWPFDLGTRGLAPLLPLICFGFYHGLAHLPEVVRRSTVRCFSYAVVLGMMVSVLAIFSDADKGPNPLRPQEIADLSQWANHHIPAGSHVAVSADWFKSDFPMMHFVMLSGRKVIPTKGEDISSYVERTEYVLYEGFPQNKNSIAYSEAGLEGHVVYRTPRNMFQIIQVGKTNATDFASIQTSAKSPSPTN